MDLGIEGRTAIICGSSQGLGFACAQTLVAEGVSVVVNGRDQGKLEKAAARLADGARGTVRAVAADLTTPEGREYLLASATTCDILINNNGGPKPGYFGDIDHDTWMQVIEANMIAPLMLTRAVLPGMKERRFGRIINITSAMVTTPRPHMAPSAGARSGLTGAMKALALEVARFNVTINNLLPERFDTDRQHQMAKAAMARGHLLRGSAGAAGRVDRGEAAGRPARIRRNLCLFMQRVGWFHVGAERAPRRRFVSGVDLIVSPPALSDFDLQGSSVVRLRGEKSPRAVLLLEQ